MKDTKENIKTAEAIRDAKGGCLGIKCTHCPGAINYRCSWEDGVDSNNVNIYNNAMVWLDHRCNKKDTTVDATLLGAIDWLLGGGLVHETKTGEAIILDEKNRVRWFASGHYLPATGQLLGPIWTLEPKPEAKDYIDVVPALEQGLRATKVPGYGVMYLGTEECCPQFIGYVWGEAVNIHPVMYSNGDQPNTLDKRAKSELVRCDAVRFRKEKTCI